MNFKLIRLQYRFLLQIAFFLLYLAVIAGILLFVLRDFNYSRNAGQKLNVVRNMVSKSYISQKNFLIHTDDNNVFYQSGQNDYTVQFQVLVNQLNDTLRLIMTDRTLHRKERVNAWSDSVALSVKNYSIAFNQLLLSIKELGTRNSGMISSLRTSSQKLVSIVTQLNQNDLSDMAVRLTNNEAEFLFASDKSAYYKIESMLDELSYHPSIASADPLISEEIGTLTVSYRSQLKNVNDLFERIGYSPESSGLMGEIARKYDALNNSVSIFESTVQAAYSKYLVFLLLFGAFAILLITSLYVFVLFKFFRSIQRPLTEIIDYSLNLSKGKNPEKELDAEAPYEFSLLNSNLTNLNNSLIEKRLFVEDLLKQKFKADLSLQGRLDTFGKTLLALKENMRKTREEQTKHAEENQVRRYQNEGVARFADILRSNSDNLTKLSDEFIKEIVRYMEAIQGGLFLLNKEGDEELHLVAAFAYDRKKYIQKTIRLGVSLVGTCALERKTINLTDIPDDYVKITSGLGEAPPNNLLLLPIMHEEHFIGVLEIASLKKFDNNQVFLGEKIVSILASTIINARINSQTSELLEKSQQQAAGMAEQEEEMRQNMEELKATQEESARREDELEGILNAIDHAFYVIEYDTEGTIQKVNQRLLYLLNLHSEKVIGKKHNQLFGKKSKADSLLFANIAEGNTVELVEKVVVNQIPLEIKNTFSPIKSKDGHTIRILNIMTIYL